ncbi:nuclear transport factor 2 family protein [Dactylosporangium sp. NPDC005572]|uniref:nuclear transport factor 2 family protein n=1 Tax=Dactylosporangium sp. NPDC005572 TaxID=3156889 RepID=UPI0033B9DC6E
MTAPVADPDLSARAAQVLYAYARAVDEGDLDALERLAYEDVALTRVDGTRHGRKAFLDLYRGFRDANLRGSKHVVTNVQAFPEDGGPLVRARAYFAATMFDADGTRVVVGQYADTMRDDGDGLRFVHKRITVERVVPLAASTAEWAGVTPKAAS